MADDPTGGSAAPTINPPPPLSPGEQQQIASAKPPAPPPQQGGGMPSLPAPSAPAVKFAPKRQGLAGVLDEVRNWMAGTQGTAVAYHDDGSRYTVHPALTAKEQWARIGARAFTGAAAGWAAGRGAGNTGKAAFAGIQAGQQMQQQAQEEQATEADKNAAAARQARLDAANTFKAQLENAEAAFRLDRLKVKGTQDDLQFAANMDKLFTQTLGGSKIGVYDSDTLQKLDQDNPQFHALATKGEIRIVPQFAGNLDPNKVAVYHVPTNNLDTPIPAELKGHHLVLPPNASDAKSEPTTQEYEPAADTTWRSYLDGETAYQTQLKNWRESKNLALTGQKTAAEAASEEAKAKNAPAMTAAELRQKQAQADEAFSTAALNRQKLNNLKAGLSENGEAKTGLDPLNPADHETIIEGMLDGTLDITKTFGLSRSNKPSPVRAQYEAEAKRRDPSWSMQKFGTMQKVIQQYASVKPEDPGGQIMSFNYFMGHAGDFLAQVDRLRNTNSPLLNQPMNYLAEHVKGNPAIPEVYNAMQTMAQESQRFLEGKALTEQDKADLKKKINESMTPAMLEGIAKQMMHSAVIRMGGLNHAYRNTMGRDFDGLLDPNSAAILKETAKGTDYESQALNLALKNYMPYPQAQATQMQIQPGEPTSTLGNGNLAVVRNGQWVDTGQKAGAR